MTDTINVREMVLDSLLEINEKQMHSHIVMKQMLGKYQFLPKMDRAFYTRILVGTLEDQLRLDAILSKVSKVPVKKMKPLIRELLRMSVYQIISMDHVPDRAVCNEAVKLAAKRGFSGLKGYVNGVLRNISRKKEELIKPSVDDPLEQLSFLYSIPVWILKMWQEDYTKEQITQMAKAGHGYQGTSVRLMCPQKKEKVIHSLEEDGASVSQNPYCEEGLILTDYDHLSALRAFSEGQIVVQDTSSMLAGRIASPKKNDYVLDMCAAPGGKSIHIASQMENTGTVEARDLTPAKVSLIEEAIQRTGLSNVICRVFDATEADDAMYEKADLVIADVPCSGLGVFGRKPEIKYRMTMDKIKELNALQRKIVKNAISYVKPGGRLIYSTCTISHIENQEMFSWIKNEGSMKPLNLDEFLPDELCSETTKSGYLQLLPGVHQSDGFFISAFIKEDKDENGH